MSRAITQRPMTSPPLAPNSLAFVDQGLEALDDSGLADADRSLDGVQALIKKEVKGE
jgi:hypothetical protein